MKKTHKAFRPVSVVLILAMLCFCAPVCLAGDESPAAAESLPEEVQSNGPGQTEDPFEPGSPGSEDREASGEASVQPLGHYTFQPKVCSVYLEEVFGKTMCETWYNLVDAVMAGEDTFACPDQHTYDWVMGQFPERCFPVLVGLIDYAWDRENSVIDGIASFTYLLPYEEVAARIGEFAAQIEGILNETLADDYSDFEKALALYEYFVTVYEYDYDSYYQMFEEWVDDITTIHFFETGTGVCQQVALAYSYLLMQAGVEATTMGGNRDSDGEGHAWSYVRINGHDYHIDPTYGLGLNTLDYFLMTDEQREAMDGYSRSSFVITSNYAQDHPHPDYIADDGTFQPLWGGGYGYLSHEDHILEYWNYDENGQYDILYFDYEGY